MSTGLNIYSDMPPSVAGYYEKRALIRARMKISAYDLCQKKSLPEGKGSTVTFWRYAPLSENTTALTEAVTNALDFGGITFAGRQKLVYQEVPVTPVVYGDYISVGLLGKLTSIDQGTEEKVDLVTDQGANSIDYILTKRFAQGCRRMRGDANTDYSGSGTTTAAGSATSVVDSGRTAKDAAKPSIGDDYWTGGFITITSGPAYGQTRQITAYTNSTGTFTTDTFDVAPGSGATYSVAVGTGIGSTSTINSKSMRRANRVLGNLMAQHYDNKYFKSLLDPDSHFDFFDDPDFNKASIYKDRTNNLETNLIGTFAGVSFGEVTRLYRETVAGVESKGAGAVHVIPIYAKEAMGCVNLGSNPSGKKNFQIYIRNWKQLGQPMPHSDTIAWQGLFEGKMLNSCFSVGMMCGASDEV
jgi:hypothetical protein